MIGSRNAIAHFILILVNSPELMSAVEQFVLPFEGIILLRKYGPSSKVDILSPSQERRDPTWLYFSSIFMANL